MRFCVLVITAAITLSALPAFADVPSKADIARATELKKKGDALVKDLKYREALEAYDESYGLVPEVAILYNQGRALQQLGEFPEAIDMLEKFEKTASADLKARVPNLSNTMAEVASNIATIVIHSNVEGATIVIRGKTMGTTPIASPLRVSAGDMTIEATKEGFAPFQRATALPGGETTNLDVILRQVEKHETTPEPETTPPPPDEHSSSQDGWKMATYTAAGIGIAAFGTGMVFFGLAVADKGTADSHCPMKACDADGRSALNEAQTFAAVSTALVVISVLGLTTAATTWIMTPKNVPVQAKVFVGPGFGAIGGTF